MLEIRLSGMYWYPLHGSEYRGGVNMWNVSCVSVPREFYEYIQCQCPVSSQGLGNSLQSAANIVTILGSYNRHSESHHFHLTFWASLRAEENCLTVRVSGPIFSSYSHDTHKLTWCSARERCNTRSYEFPMNANEEIQVIAARAPVLINYQNQW